jgi:hypothetical protein
MDQARTILHAAGPLSVDAYADDHAEPVLAPA